ncbi:hypothetical protein NBRC116492_30110 [Aurantivibrio infirmus]
MNDTFGLKIREIFHFHYGICQMIYFAGGNCWVGLNEKNESLWAPDIDGGPNMDRVRKPQYLYREQLSYLEILNSAYQADCMIIEKQKEDSIA